MRFVCFIIHLSFVAFSQWRTTFWRYNLFGTKLSPFFGFAKSSPIQNQLYIKPIAKIRCSRCCAFVFFYSFCFPISSISLFVSSTSFRVNKNGNIKPKIMKNKEYCFNGSTRKYSGITGVRSHETFTAFYKNSPESGLLGNVFLLWFIECKT